MSDYRTVKALKQLDKDLAVPFRGIFLLQKKTTKTARNGNPFLSIQVGDAGGSFNANCFGDSAVFAALDPAE